MSRSRWTGSQQFTQTRSCRRARATKYYWSLVLLYTATKRGQSLSVLFFQPFRKNITATLILPALAYSTSYFDIVNTDTWEFSQHHC